MKKVLMVIGSIALGVLLLIGIIFVIVSATSQKLECESTTGKNITIMYNDEKITGYTAFGMTYDMDTQNEYAKQVGMENYLVEFSGWFKEHVGGVCTKK